MRIHRALLILIIITLVAITAHFTALFLGYQPPIWRYLK